MTRIKPGISVAAVAVSVLALTGCGGPSQAQREARQECIDNAVDRAEAASIQQAFRDGRIGTAAAIRRSLPAAEKVATWKVESFLSADGTMIPWPQLNSQQQRTFLWWADSGQVTETVFQEATDASLRAKEAAETSCKT
jgi:hypothetical protein